MSLANTLSAVSMVAVVTNQFADEPDEDFAATLANLRRELAPTTIMESVWVDMALLAIKRLRNSALDETDDSATDSKWLRFQSMAERSLNNAINRLEKGRRQAARAAAAAETPKPRASTAKPRAAQVVPETKPPAPPEPPAATVAPVAPTVPVTPIVETPEQFAQVKQAAAETDTLEELMSAIDPAVRAEFAEQFRDDVKEMLAEGFEPEEIVRGFPALTLDDVRAFQSGVSLQISPTALAN